MANGGRPRVTRLCVLASLSLLVAAAATRAEAQTKAYVTHSASNIVSVIDTATDTVMGTVPVGAAPMRVAMTRDGTRAYVTNRDSDSISVIETDSDAVIATIPVGDSPTYLAVTPDGSFLYVMTAGGAVDVVDTTLGTVVTSIPVGSSGDIAITPDGARAYVAAGLVYVIDIATNAVITSFAAESAPIPGVSTTALSVAISPDGARAYVGVFVMGTGPFGFTAGGSIVVVDTASASVTNEIVLGSVPGQIALTPDGSRAYVGIQSTFVNTGYGSGFLPGRHVVVIDTITDSVSWSTTIDLGSPQPHARRHRRHAGPARRLHRRALHQRGGRGGRQHECCGGFHFRDGRSRPCCHHPRRHSPAGALHGGCRRRQLDDDDSRWHGDRECPGQRSDWGFCRDARARHADAGVVDACRARARHHERGRHPCGKWSRRG